MIDRTRGHDDGVDVVRRDRARGSRRPGRRAAARPPRRDRPASPPPRRARARGSPAFRRGASPSRRDRRRRSEEAASSLTARSEYVSVAIACAIDLHSPDAAGRSGRGATLADVAEHAGVSTSTASRALNGRGGLAPTRGPPCVEAAATLHFQPSALARSLRTRRRTGRLRRPDVASPFYAAALKGAQGTLELSRLPRSCSWTRDQDARPRARRGRDAALPPGRRSPRRDGRDAAGRLRRGGRRAGDAVRSSSTASAGKRRSGTVTLDNEGGIELLVAHLSSTGTSGIGFLAGSPATRASGIERACDAFHASRVPRRGLEARDVKGLRVDDRGRTAGSSSSSTRVRGPPPSLASSAELALGCLSAAGNVASSCRASVALVAFDDPYFGDLLEPSLTAVSHTTRAPSGREPRSCSSTAMREESETRHVRIPVTLVRRRSCGCTRGAEWMLRPEAEAPAISLPRRREALRQPGGAAADRPRDRGGRILLPARSVRLRQDHNAQPSRRLHRPDDGRDHASGESRRAASTAPPARKHGVSVLRALPHMTRAGERRFRADDGPRAEGERPAHASRRRWRSSDSTTFADRLPDPAVGRPAATRRSCACARQPTRGAAAGRAARRARPETAQAAAVRARSDSSGRRHDLRLRHPRPGRGDVDGRPDRRHERR